MPTDLRHLTAEDEGPRRQRSGMVGGGMTLRLDVSPEVQCPATNGVQYGVKSMNFMQQKLTLAGMTGAVTTSSASSSSSGSMGHFMAKKKANSLITKKQGGKPLKPLKKMDSSSLLEAIAAGPPAMRTPHYGGFALHQSSIKDTRALKPLEEREQPLTDEGHESRKQDKEAQVEFPQNIQQQESSDLGRKNSSTIQDDDISQFGGSAFDSSVDFDSQQLLSREIHWL